MSLTEAFRAKAASPLPSLQTAWQMAFLPVWPARKIWARPPRWKGASNASSQAVGWSEMAHREGVPRTRPPNRDFLGF